MRGHDFKKLSIYKTIWFNLKYFGVGGVLRPLVLCSRNVTLKRLGGTVKVDNSSKGIIRLGFDHVGIIDEKHERFVWENEGTIEFEGRARLNVGCRVVCLDTGTLNIGDGLVINGRTSIICGNNISIGANSLISWDCLIMDDDFHKVIDTNTREVCNLPKGISIGKHVWVACRSTILNGARINDDSIVAAGSVVAKQIAQSNIVFANSRIVRTDSNWE